MISWILELGREEEEIMARFPAGTTGIAVRPFGETQTTRRRAGSKVLL